MERFRTPTVFTQSKIETGAGDGVKVGDMVGGNMVIGIEGEIVSICYSKRFNTCNQCKRVSCPFSGAAATKP